MERLMHRFALFLLVCMLLPAGVTSAQDGDELQCSDSDIYAAIDLALAQLEEARSQDASTALASIVGVRAMLAELDAQCLGLTFSGKGSTVHGPVYVPQGIYRLSATTPGTAIILHGFVLEGECGDRPSDKLYILNEFGGGAVSAETVFRSKGCTLLFETSNVRQSYILVLEKIR
jgi:hypothetical protein